MPAFRGRCVPGGFRGRPPGRPGPAGHRPPPPPPHRPYRPYRGGCLPGCLVYVFGLLGVICAIVALAVSFIF